VTQPFPGFPPETMRFLAELKANNDRAWFADHREAYETAIRAPAEALVAALAPELAALSGRTVKPKIFRIHRDVRFSKDKSPYNAHLHIGFGFGPAGGGEGPPACGFFFGLEPDKAQLGGGAFEFPGAQLDRYRAAVADPAEGAALASLAQGLEAAGFRLSEPELKRVPAPYPADHPRGELLRRKGLTAWRDVSPRDVVESPALVDEMLGAFKAIAPLNAWVDEAVD
jgi:uncharacterized protein (TIGR02453 family)